MNTFTMNGAQMGGSSTEVPYVGPNARVSYFAESGVNNWKPNVRATSAIIVIENKRAASEWAIEGITADVRDAGRRR